MFSAVKFLQKFLPPFSTKTQRERGPNGRLGHKASHHFPSCSLPSPIVMSDNRRGCGKHFYVDNPLTYHRQMGQNNKASHANICFRKWFNRDKKEIFSNRLATPQKCEKRFKHSEPLNITSIKDELYPLPPLMDPVADPSLIPHDIRPYIPDGPIYIEEQVRRRQKFHVERTYVVPGSALWIKYIRDNIKNGLLPWREFQITPASTSQSTPSNSAVPSFTKRRRPTIKKIKRHDAVANANKACEDSNSNHPSPYPSDSNASNMELDEQVNMTPTTPIRNSTHIIQLPSPSNTNDSLAEDSLSKYFF
ncbi:hypothetical protein C1646_784371 [Rhizophagus diaphanus]|nr:hypothetical protein C1646_784371 [Rhizophagus diaphanus] [Rhizophagus sp. MUCL 43196]